MAELLWALQLLLRHLWAATLALSELLMDIRGLPAFSGAARACAEVTVSIWGLPGFPWTVLACAEVVLVVLKRRSLLRRVKMLCGRDSLPEEEEGEDEPVTDEDCDYDVDDDDDDPDDPDDLQPVEGETRPPMLRVLCLREMNALMGRSALQKMHNLLDRPPQTPSSVRIRFPRKKPTVKPPQRCARESLDAPTASPELRREEEMAVEALQAQTASLRQDKESLQQELREHLMEVNRLRKLGLWENEWLQKRSQRLSQALDEEERLCERAKDEQLHVDANIQTAFQNRVVYKKMVEDLKEEWVRSIYHYQESIVWLERMCHEVCRSTRHAKSKIQVLEREKEHREQTLAYRVASRRPLFRGPWAPATFYQRPGGAGDNPFYKVT